MVSSAKAGERAALNACERRTKDVFLADQVGVIRSPVFSTNRLKELYQSSRTELSAHVKIMLQDRKFQEALFFASEGLYERAVAWAAGDRSFGDIDVSIAKYVIRMSSRPTPFGLFSSVGTIVVGKRQTDVRAPEMAEIKKSVSLDYNALIWLADVKLRNGQSDRLRYTANDTIAFYEDYISFLARVKGNRNHALQNVQLERSEILDYVLTAASARGGATLDEISRVALLQFGQKFNLDEIKCFISELVNREVLTIDGLVCPTSTDHLGDLIEATPTAPDERALLLEVKGQIDNLNNAMLGEKNRSIEQMQGVANTISKAGLAGGKSIKADAVVSESLGSLGLRDVRRIERIINEITEFIPRNDRLKLFKKRFVERYGDASVRLSDLIPVLDGFGYPDEVGATAALADLIKSGSRQAKATEARPLNALEMHAIALIAQNEITDYVDLSEYKRTIDLEVDMKKFPGCLVAWVALWAHRTLGQVIELKSLGAQEPGRIMGRFAHAVPELRKYLEDAESCECGQLIGQVVHVPVTGAGNIITRCAMLGPEIKIRAGGQASAGDILLADLEVRVSDDRVFLWSRSMQADVTPRMNSAHAFERSSGQAIYMFLNNVSNQDMVCRTPSLRAKIPQAQYLPGLKYKGLLLERQTWCIKLDDINDVGKGGADMLRALRSLADKIRLPDVFEECGNDSSIPYNLSQDWLALEFLKELRKKGAMVLTEAFPVGMVPAVAATDGPRMHEIQIALRSRLDVARRSPDKPQAFMKAAGQKWLYWQIYCKATVQNSVVHSLLISVGKFDQKLQEHMFFIRYIDSGGEHIRVRFSIDGEENRQALIRVVDNELERLMDGDIVQSFILKDYVPEIARYGGAELLKRAERVFCFDSSLIIKTFGKISGALNENWRSAAVGADTMLRAIGVEMLKDRMEFAIRAAADFQREMKFDFMQRKKIGRLFNNSAPIFDFKGGYADNVSALREFLETKKIGDWYDWSSEGFGEMDQVSIYRYRWSLLHMRFNRLFPRRPRIQEAVCWELLKRSYMRLEKVMGEPTR